MTMSDKQLDYYTTLCQSVYTKMANKLIDNLGKKQMNEKEIELKKGKYEVTEREDGSYVLTPIEPAILVLDLESIWRVIDYKYNYAVLTSSGCLMFSEYSFQLNSNRTAWIQATRSHNSNFIVPAIAFGINASDYKWENTQYTRQDTWVSNN